jgi:hypothetical protein
MHLNSNYEVLTSQGWCSFNGINKSATKKMLYKLTLSSGAMVRATIDHQFFVAGCPTKLQDLRINESQIDIRDGKATVIAIDEDHLENVYDLVAVDNDNHEYLINDIMSKNCDELAFVPPGKQVDFWTSIQPVLSTGGSCIVTSTPKNDEDQFAQIWKSAQDNTDQFGNIMPDGVGKNGFFAVLAPWWEHPDRDEAWAKPFRESLGEARFRQEFCGEFITDDDTLMNPMTLARLRGRDPSFYTGTIRWYVEPEPNKTYLVALDPSLGTHNDYGAIEIFQLPEMIQIAEWQNNMAAPRRQVAVMMEALYALDGIVRENPQQIGDPDIYWTFENNTIGESILTIVEDTGEERFPGSLVTERRRKGIQNKRVRKGLYTLSKPRLSSLARMKSLVESDRMTIHSRNLIKELKNFVAVGNSFKAKQGEHDDLVMATSLIIRMIDIVLAWGTSSGDGDLREYIDDSEIGLSGEIEPLPTIIG